MNKISLVLLLVATVSPLWAQEAFDQEFAPDKSAPEGFRANRTSYSAVMDVLEDSRPEVTLEDLDRLQGLQLENIWAALGEYEDNYVRGLVSTRPGERIIGRALTIRTLPSRPDLRRATETLAEEGNWDTRYYVRAGEEAKPGDVLVVDLGGADGHIFFGDITALGMQLRGARGVIIDGGTRDLEELSADTFEGFPVLARFFDPVGPRWVDVDWNLPIRVGQATVLPGDIVVAEDEAVLFFPPEILDEVVEKASARQAKEDYQRELVRQKKYRMRDVYPNMHPEIQRQYEKKKKKKEPTPQSR